MDKKQSTLLCTIVCVGAVVVVVYYVWNHCKMNCWKQSGNEGYTRNALSTIGELKRTPVTFAFRGDGMTQNPHYRADPEDRLVPLEYGGLNPYKRVVNRPLDPLRRLTTRAIMNIPNSLEPGAYITNDSKARRDMVESGDLEWFKMLDNMPTNAHKKYMTERDYDWDAARPNFDQPPLYSGEFHYNAILGQ